MTNRGRIMFMSTWKSALLAGAMMIVPAQAFAAPNKEAPVVVFEPSQTKPQTIPETEYNSEAAMADAKAKMRFARDQLAGKEMDVGRYYMEKRDFTAAINRFKTVVDKFQTTSHVPEALERLTESYVALGVFAEAQKATISDCTVEIIPGLMAGQRQIPVKAAGCYVPGGRYSHIASAIMTITTANVAGVPHIAACSPPRPGTGIPAAMIFTMDLCGADVILNLGGVQGISIWSGSIV